MKNTFLKSFMTLFFAVLTISVHAQTEWPVPDYSDEYLGIHCYITVDLNNDSVVNGYLKYTISVPKETVISIQGPASAYLSNNLGSTIDIYVHRLQLELALADMSYAQVPFALFVDLWKDSYGNITTELDSTAQQCYYYVVFNLSTLN